MTTSHGANASAPRLKRGRKRSSQWLLPVATVVGLLAVFEVLTVSGIMGSQFPAVHAVAISLSELATTELFWTQVGDTLLAWITGFGVAALLAIPLGLLIAANDFAFRSTRLIVDFLRPIPPIAILPLAVLLVGTGFEMKVYLVAFSAFFPVLFQTLYGAQDVDPVARETARAYGFSRFDQYREVVIPSATPYIATGLRLAATIALVVTIATELIVGSIGLGYQINQVRYAGDTPAMYALIFVAGIIGWLVTVIFSSLEKRMLFWHHSHRAEGHS